MEGTPLNSFSLMTTQSRQLTKLGEFLDWCSLPSLGDWSSALRASTFIQKRRLTYVSCRRTIIQQ